MKTESKLATFALAGFSVWVPLVGIILWYMCNKRKDEKAAKLFAICSLIGFVINFVPRLIGAM